MPQYDDIEVATAPPLCEGIALLAQRPDRGSEKNTAEVPQKPSKNPRRLKIEWLPTRQNQSVLGQVDPEKGNHIMDSRMNQPESVAVAHPPNRCADKNTAEVQQKPSRNQRRLKIEWMDPHPC